MDAWLWQWTSLICCLFWWTCDCRNHLEYLFLVSTARIMLPRITGESEDNLVKPWKVYRAGVTGKGSGFVRGSCSEAGIAGWAEPGLVCQPLALMGSVRYRTCQLRKGSCCLVLCHAEILGPACPAFLLGSPAAHMPSCSTGVWRLLRNMFHWSEM